MDEVRGGGSQRYCNGGRSERGLRQAGYIGMGIGRAFTFRFRYIQGMVPVVGFPRGFAM